LIIGCQKPSPDEKKIIDTGRFEIEVPSNWNYKKERGIDSFVGRIKSNGVDLYFDWSEMGYANQLIPNEEEFIYERKWEWMPMEIPYGEIGVTYTSANNIEAERDRIMKEEGITDTSLVKVEEIQIPEEKIVIEGGEYRAILTYKDTTIQVMIEIPEEVRNHKFEIDTIGTYKRKIIRPKNGDIGMTAVYFEDLESDFNFNLVGENLSLENQEKAIKAFKSIKIKRE